MCACVCVSVCVCVCECVCVCVCVCVLPVGKLAQARSVVELLPPRSGNSDEALAV